MLKTYSVQMLKEKKIEVCKVSLYNIGNIILSGRLRCVYRS